MYFFSDSYEQARRKFYAVCKRLYLPIITRINPVAKSPAGEDLVMDFVWCGNPKAEKVLVVTSGTHGLEAGPGAATILQWLHSEEYRQLPDDTAVMLVHGINAYGWAYASRNNENNIDLNRNYLDHSETKPVNQAYAELHALVLCDEVSDSELAKASANYQAYAQEHGINTAIHGITAGQYSHPDGIGYGGEELSWSYQTLNTVLHQNLGHATKIVLIDWHTGIGEYAKPFFIFREPAHSGAFQLASKWWGEEQIHRHDIFSDSDNPNYTGLLMDGLKRELVSINAAEIVVTTIEWGTYELDTMLQAIFIDRWLRVLDTKPNSAQSLQIKTKLIERFYPSMPCWRNSVLQHAEQIYKDTLSGLQNWD
jgi:hypothetical protein